MILPPDLQDDSIIAQENQKVKNHIKKMQKSIASITLSFIMPKLYCARKRRFGKPTVTISGKLKNKREGQLAFVGNGLPNLVLK